VFLILLASFGITYVPLAIALVLCSRSVSPPLYGWTVERVAYRSLRGSARLAPLISAIAFP